MEGFKRRAVVSLLSSYISQFVTTAVNLGTKLLLARLIAPDDLGVYAIALFFLLAGDMLVDMGISQHIVREKERPYGSMLTIRLVLSLVLFIVVQFIAHKLTRWGTEFPDVIRLMSITLIVKAFSGVPSLFLDRELLIQKSVLPQMVRIGTMGLVSVILAYFGYGVWALAWATVFAEVLYGILIWRAVRGKLLLGLTWRHVGRLVYESRYLFLIGIMGFALQQGDTAVLGALLTNTQVGYYTMAFSLIVLVSKVVESAVFRVVYPMFCECVDDISKVGKIYRIATLAIYSIEVPIYFFLLFNSPQIVSVLLGEKWLPAAKLMQALAVFGIINPFCTFGNEVLRAKKLDSILTASTIIGAVTLIGFGYLFTYWLGAIGMVVAHYFIVGSLPVILVLRRLVWKEFNVLFSQLLVVYAGTFILMLLADLIFGTMPYVQTAVSGLLIFLCWYAYYRMFGEGIGPDAVRVLLSRTPPSISEAA
jgi:O-antigen/teichoic acid export membrane protein